MRPSCSSRPGDKLHNARSMLRSTSKQPISRPRDNARMKRLRLTSPALDFWVDAAVVTRQGRWLVTTTICDEREIGTGHSLRQALWQALQPLGNDACKALLRDTQKRSR
jgi:hypothetical protein